MKKNPNILQYRKQKKITKINSLNLNFWQINTENKCMSTKRLLSRINSLWVKYLTQEKRETNPYHLCINIQKQREIYKTNKLERSIM